MGTSFDWQYFTISGFKPGLTINFEPAAIALSTCSVVSTVPAPTNISGHSSDILRILSSAAAVLNVISAQGRPPDIKALAKGTASFASSIAITGTIPILLSSSTNLFMGYLRLEYFYLFSIIKICF